MYPKNAASPERIAIGAVIQISDGAPQSSGVTITVRGQGGAEASGGGTTAYGATGVIVYYTPTQAETNFTSFTVVASKAGCIPVAQTIVTTASSTAGRTRPDGGTVDTATTTTTATNLTNLPTIPANWITAAGIAAGAIDAATFAADVDAEARGWLGLASANLDTQLADIPTVAEFEARTIVSADYLVVGDLSGLALETTAQSILTDTGTTLPATLSTIAGYIDTEIQTIITAIGVIDGIVDDILVDTGTTIPAAIADVPTVAEFEARTILAANYALEATSQANAAQLVDILSLVEAVALTGAATYQAPASATTVTGTESSGTVASVATADGVTHQHTDAAGAMEVIYDYEMGAAEVAVEVLFRGRIDGANDSLAVQVYDWIGTTWNTLWTQAGTGGSTDTNRAEPLLAKHTGTGADDGKVRIRFYAASGLSSATLFVDQLLVAKTVTEVDLTPGALAAVNAEVDTAITDANLPTLSQILTTAMTESYAADGAAPTLAQALFLIQQSLHEFAISSTTRTVKKLDKATTAATFTLDDASSPTSTTRAT